MRNRPTPKILLLSVMGAALCLFTGCPGSVSTNTVSYEANGATGGSAPQDSTAYAAGDMVTVLGNSGSLSRTLSNFEGWNTAADGSGTTFGGGDTFAMEGSDVTLYARWHLDKLIGPNGAIYDNFGYSVAASSDGSVLVVGAYNKTVGSNASQGVAYVFTKSGGSWSLAQELTAGDGAANDSFGYYVATSSDGNVIIVGAFNKTVGSKNYQGAAYVFTKSGSTWAQTQELMADDGAAEDFFGLSVATSSDGSVIIIGASNKTVGGKVGQGAAYVFTKSGSTWAQTQELTEGASGTANDYFGCSVAASSDGSILVAGALNKTVGGNVCQGAAYVFTKSGSTWAQTQELTADDGAAEDFFGTSVATSSDGSVIIVGARSRAGQGAACVFTKSGSTWAQTQELTEGASGTANDYFGVSVATSSDGSVLVVGACNKTVGSNDYQGAAYVFTKSGSTWAQTQELMADDGAEEDFFGYSVAASSDGSVLVVGAYGKTVGSNGYQGAAYVFTGSGGAWSQ